VAQGSGPATATAPQGTEAGHEPKGEHPPEEKHAPGKHEHHDHDHGDHDHDHHNHEPLPEDQREVTAILVAMPDGPLGDVSALHMYTKVNEGVTAQAIFPIREVRSLMEGLVGTARWLLLVLSGLVVIVAGIGVMVSIYNSMSDRRRDIAIMRSLGASRGSVMLVILLEAIMLSLLGGLAGVVLAHGTIGALEGLLVRLTGVSMNPFQVEPLELIIIPGLILLASLVGYLPALSAYRTDVAKALTSAP
jgi:putative ABC transport system permease protein